MLYIMRHGKTEWNALHKIQGRTDIPLNEEGRLMAEKAWEEYKNLHIDVCYCSPLIRAVETAQIVLKNRDIPIIKDERLMEMSFGDYEGIENSFALPDCLGRALCKNRFLSERSDRATATGGKGYPDCRTWCDECKHYLPGERYAD